MLVDVCVPLAELRLLENLIAETFEGILLSRYYIPIRRGITLLGIERLAAFAEGGLRLEESLRRGKGLPRIIGPYYILVDLDIFGYKF